MKKFIALTLALGTLLTATASFAQRNDSQIRLKNGRTTLRIQVGDDRDDRDLLKRVHRLERAVSDLQVQVYQLQQEPVRYEQFMCSADFFSVGFVSAKAPSRAEAEAEVMRICNKKKGGIFCEKEKISCERI